MTSFYKKIAFSLFFTFIFIACQEDDTSTSTNDNSQEGRVQATNTERRDLFNEECAFNPSEVKLRNPAFNISENGNLRLTGKSARELLSGFQYRSLTIEMLAVEGFEPSQQAIDNLRTFIDQRLNKPDGVKIINRTIPSPNIEKFTVKNIFEKIEIENRTQFNKGTDIAVFMFFADSDDEKSTFDVDSSNVILGTAYFNTSIVIYQSTLRKITQNNPTAFATIESGTLQHELCHLLGLVNDEDNSATDHEDEDENGEGNGHCNVERCLMEATARLIPDMMGGLTPLRLDPLCIQDLQAKGGK